MTTETETLESLLRPLAEQRVGAITTDKVAQLLAGSMPLDPRFDALRREHEIVYSWGESEYCFNCDAQHPYPDYCLDASLGAIVRAAWDCGPRVHGAVIDALFNDATREPELAGARALVAAVEV